MARVILLLGRPSVYGCRVWVHLIQAPDSLAEYSRFLDEKLCSEFLGAKTQRVPRSKNHHAKAKMHAPETITRSSPCSSHLPYGSGGVPFGTSITIAPVVPSSRTGLARSTATMTGVDTSLSRKAQSPHVLFMVWSAGSHLLDTTTALGTALADCGHRRCQQLRRAPHGRREPPVRRSALWWSRDNHCRWMLVVLDDRSGAARSAVAILTAGTHGRTS